MQDTSHGAAPARAWIITGPTSGIGRRTALELARHGTVVLVGRDPGKLAEVQDEIQARPGQRAVAVFCDLSARRGNSCGQARSPVKDRVNAPRPPGR